MPKVGNKKFAYTPKGRKAAKKARAAVGAKKKRPRKPMGIRRGY